MKKYFFCFFLLIHYFAFSQQSKIDSLNNLLKTDKEDTNKVMSILDLSEQYINIGNYEMGLKYAHEAHSVSEKINFKKGVANSFFYIGYIYYHISKDDSASIYFSKALRVREDIGDKKGIAKCYRYIGVIFDDQGLYDKALESQIKSLKINEEIGNKSGVATAYQNIGIIYKEQGNYDKALESYSKSLSIKQETGDSAGIGASYGNIGNIYKYQNNFEKALEYYLSALKIFEKINDKQQIANSYSNLGGLYSDDSIYDKALMYNLESLKIKEEIGDRLGMAISFGNIGTIYLKQNKLLESSQYLNQSLGLFKEIGYRDGIKENYSLLSDLHFKKGEYKEAYEFHKLFSDLKDSLLNEEKNKQMTEMNVKYESEKKDKELIKQASEKRQLEADAKQKSLERNAFIVGFALMIVLAFYIFRGYRQKQKANEIISKQKHLVEEHQKEIVDSINYAKRIQFTLLAHEELLKENLNDHFVLFKPKDIVSGDFYWATKKENRFYLACCDCTGHGVPGAFMSLLNISFLNEAIIEKNISEPNEVLNHVRERLIQNVSQDGGQDGMDAILVCIEENHISYAAANNAPVIIQNGKLKTLSFDKMPVGKGEKTSPFTLHTIDLQKGDSLYLFTDGYADQFGGPKGKKIKYKQLEELLISVCNESLSQQSEIIEQKFIDWKGNLEQVDDVCIIGIRV